MAKSCYIFPHVPKCGGTSLLKQFQTSDLRLRLDYRALMGEQMLQRDRECANVDYSHFDLIYGHFPIYRYTGPRYRYIALVRDPLDRCVSSYKFHQLLGQLYPENEGFHPALGRRISAGEVSFVDYLTIEPNMLRVYAHVLQYWDASRFTLIGRTDRYSEFTERLSDLLGIEISSEVQERKSDIEMTLSEDEKEKARHLLRDEYAWFDQFCRDIAPIQKRTAKSF